MKVSPILVDCGELLRTIGEDLGLSHTDVEPAAVVWLCTG